MRQKNRSGDKATERRGCHVKTRMMRSGLWWWLSQIVCFYSTTSHHQQTLSRPNHLPRSARIAVYWCDGIAISLLTRKLNMRRCNSICSRCCSKQSQQRSAVWRMWSSHQALESYLIWFADNDLVLNVSAVNIKECDGLEHMTLWAAACNACMHTFKCMRVKRWVTENGQQPIHPIYPSLHPFLYPLSPALELARVCWRPSQLSRG